MRPRLNSATQYLMVEKTGALIPCTFCKISWISVGVFPANQKCLMIARNSCFSMVTSGFSSTPFSVLERVVLVLISAEFSIGICGRTRLFCYSSRERSSNCAFEDIRIECGGITDNPSTTIYPRKIVQGKECAWIWFGKFYLSSIHKEWIMLLMYSSDVQEARIVSWNE